MSFIDVRNDDSVKKYNKEVTKRPIIVLFYADWCGHCKDLEPIWSEFEKIIKQKPNPKIGVNKVNSDYMSKISGPKDVMGFPTISYIKNGSKKREYSGPRNVESISQFYDELERDLSSEHEDGDETEGILSMRIERTHTPIIRKKHRINLNKTNKRSSKGKRSSKSKQNRY